MARLPRSALLASLLLACSPAAPPEVAPPLPAPAASSAPPPAPSPQASARPAPEPASPCLPALAAGAEIFSSKLEGSTLTVCMQTEDQAEGGQGYPCIAIDTKTKKLAFSPAVARETPPGPAEPASPPPPLSATATDVTVCTAPKSCKTVKVTPKKPPQAGHGDSSGEGLIAALSPDGKQIAVIVPEAISPPPRGTPYAQVFVDVFSVDKGKRTARHKMTTIFQDTSDIWSVRWLDGNTLHLGAHRCCGPDGGEALLDLRKGTVEAIGDPALFSQIKPGVWLQGNGDRFDESASAAVQLTFVHLESGKRVRLKLPARPNKEPEGHELSLHKIADSSFAIVHTTPPGVAWIDAEKEALIDHISFPSCK